MRVDLITGVTEQNGVYLAEFLLRNCHFVYGMKRNSLLFNTIDHFYQYQHESNLNSKLMFEIGNRFFRRKDVGPWLANSAKFKTKLGRQLTYGLALLINIMVKSNLHTMEED